MEQRAIDKIHYHGTNSLINQGWLKVIPQDEDEPKKRRSGQKGYLIYYKENHGENAEDGDGWKSKPMPLEKFYPVSFCC